MPIIPFLRLIKKNGMIYLLKKEFYLNHPTLKFYYSASNIVLTNIPLPVFTHNFLSMGYISRHRLYIQTRGF